MTSVLQDVRVAWRALARRPGFVAVAVLTLALGIGATTALFSVVYGVLLRPLPYHEADRIVALWQTARTDPGPSVGGSVAHVNYLDWKRHARSFESLALYSGANFAVASAGEAEIVPGAVVTTDFFRVFGASPMLGRGFTAEEDRPNGPRVVVVSHAFWVDRLGSRTDVIGSLLEMSGRAVEIVGVAPPGFAFPNGARLWQPVANDDATCGRACVYLDGVGRLADGVSVEEASAEMRSIAERLERTYPEANTNITIGVTPLRDQIVGDVRRPLLLLFGAVTMLMLIACANVANLLLVRGAGRHGELAVRAALGAGRGRLVRFLLAESALLACLGALGGLLVAWWGVDALKSAAPVNLPRLAEIAIDYRVLAFAGLSAALTALLFGLGPAVRVARTNLSLMGGRGQVGTPHAGRTRAWLLGAEVALSLLLLFGAGLLLRSMYELRTIEPGWRSEGVVVATVGLPSIRYADARAMVAGFERLDEALSAIPGVEVVGRINGLPLGPGINVQDFRRADRPEPPVGQVPTALYRLVDADYFQAVGIPVLAGRPFDARDSAGGAPALIISREMADRFWPGEDPIGKRVLTGSVERTIVGVVGGVRSTNLEELPQPEMYVPHAQTSTRSATFVLRSALPAAQVLSAVRRVIRQFDPRLPIYRPGTLSELEAAALARPRFYLLLLGLFAVVAVSLAAVGVYGVVGHVVAQRTREIGVRVALGASRADVVRLVVREGLLPAGAGVVSGVAAALASGRVIAGLLYGIAPADPATLAGAVATTLAVVAVACAVPAWRATRVDPAMALRLESQ